MSSFWVISYKLKAFYRDLIPCKFSSYNYHIPYVRCRSYFELINVGLWKEMYYIKLFQENNPRSSFLKWVEVITTSVSWLSLPFGIMIYLTLISIIFPYQCINLHHLFINIYEISFLYLSNDTKYSCECPRMFQ